MLITSVPIWGVESNKDGLNHKTTDYNHTNQVYILENTKWPPAITDIYMVLPHGASTTFHNIIYAKYPTSLSFSMFLRVF
jgi:hypothetical protein